ncbi:MAG: glycoside hydrolase family 92 protein, partial [Bacteroidales bacterium]|nr:glycoside hydrolase family 92 protein [Bacteroidales bacterium]
LETPQVNAEVTSTLRTGYHKYTFEENGEQSFVLDLGFALNWDRPLETAITLEGNNTITGYRHSKGWANNQKVFFVAEFSKPLTSYNLYENHKAVEGKSAVANRTAAQFFFNPEEGNTLQFKLALSSVSIENAKENLDNPGTFNFDEIRQESRDIWQEALEKIEVQTPIDSLKTIFYTALYHAQIAPVTFSDKNGQFRLQNDSIAQADGFTAYSTLSLWDTFRAEHPLLTILNPKLTSDVINSMLAYYDESGSLPVWTLYGNETNTMTGYHSIPVITEAYIKGIRGYDAERVYDAMKATMMQDARGLKEYKQYGYLPFDKLDESVTITLEYAYNDWCVAQMAKALDKEEDYQYFSKRAEAWKHLLDAESGFMRGKSSDGKSWNEPFDPKFSRHREHTDYTEGNAWQHSWFVLHDTDEFIKMHGGAAPFTQKLEQLFAESSEITGEDLSPDISGLIGQYAHGNEPSHHITFLFNRAGQPWCTQYWTREILTTQYSTKPEGISGNEDAGQMSAWYVLTSLGIYSFNPASGDYEITSPLFEESKIKLPNGKTFTIKANGVSMDNKYIQSANLNGEPYNKTSISHAAILEGGELVFEMGRQELKDKR